MIQGFLGIDSLGFSEGGIKIRRLYCDTIRSVIIRQSFSSGLVVDSPEMRPRLLSQRLVCLPHVFHIVQGDRMQDLFPHHVLTKGPVNHGHALQIACHRTMIVERVSRLVEVQVRSDLDGFPAKIIDNAVENRWRYVVESPKTRRYGGSYDCCFRRFFCFFGNHPLLLTGSDTGLGLGQIFCGRRWETKIVRLW